MQIVTRCGLVFLGMAAAFLGVWATADPAGFFVAFSGLGIHWVDLLPPYNEHLVRDVGGLYLGQAVIYGPGTALGRGGAMEAAALAGRLPLAGAGDGVVSFVHVDDAAEAFAAALASSATGT